MRGGGGLNSSFTDDRKKIRGGFEVNGSYNRCIPLLSTSLCEQ